MTTVDFDLHGLAGIRLIDATPTDARAVGRQLGPLAKPLDREPEITIRFVDRAVDPSRLRYLGAREVGWSDDGFFVLKSRKTPIVARLPMGDVGGRCEIVCERGLPAVPFLIAILNLTVLANGALPLHAAAFELDGVGTLITGWSKGGKTELLMAAAGAGARYIGDEWVYLTTDGRMFGIPEPIRLWDWHLDQLPAVRAGLGGGDRLKLRAIPAMSRLERAMPGPVRRSRPGRAARRAMPILEDQLRVDLPPETLFGSVGDLSGRLDRILFVVSAAAPETTLEPIEPLAVADRMIASLMYERREFLALWQQARFAHPGIRNEHIETFEERQRELLRAVFTGRPACLVTHPYPVDIHALFQAVRPAIAGT
ncbi:MAG TPA: hypothetical protein VFM38_14725 [Candidatus Limnocylindrales bacterium]|nr:hypothetical protein [Candidatus Limnocylindrales bacterium]